MRRRNAWLTGATTTVGHLANEQIALTSESGGRRLTVLLNIADREHRFPGGPAEVLAPAGTSGDPWLLPARSWRLLAPT